MPIIHAIISIHTHSELTKCDSFHIFWHENENPNINNRWVNHHFILNCLQL